MLVRASALPGTATHIDDGDGAPCSKEAFAPLLAEEHPHPHAWPHARHEASGPIAVAVVIAALLAFAAAGRKPAAAGLPPTGGQSRLNGVELSRLTL